MDDTFLSPYEEVFVFIAKAIQNSKISVSQLMPRLRLRQSLPSLEIDAPELSGIRHNYRKLHSLIADDGVGALDCRKLIGPI